LERKIPDNVFFMDTTVGGSRSGKQGEVINGLQPPDYPWTARLPPDEAIVPKRVAYIQNQFENAPKGWMPWSFESFVEGHEAFLEELKEAGHKSVADRVYVQNLTVCEVQSEYVSRTNADRRVVDIDDMHRDNAEVVIGKFGPRNTGIGNKEVAEKIGRMLPGETKKPRQLKEVRRVHMVDPEQARRDRRCAYYTEHDFDLGNCGYDHAPDIISTEDTDLEGETPNTGGDAVRYFFPEFGKGIGGYEGVSDNDSAPDEPFLAACRFEGHTEPGEDFVIEGVTIL
jgi:hypothetical protein